MERTTTHSTFPGRRLVLLCAFLTAAAAGVVARDRSAAAAVTIWPINPVIAAGTQATPLWLENNSAEPLTLQIRVMRWTQQAQVERFEDAAGLVVASPPLTTIAPGRRQLVRLVSTAAAPPNRELAYRVLVDELPNVRAQGAGGEGAAGQEASMGVAFRMRYSLPLFVYGNGLRPDAVTPAIDAAPLTWRVDASAEPSLVLRNAGPIHARVSKVRLVSSRRAVDITTGLLGYVLPGAEMRWPFPAGVEVADDDSLEMVVNNTPTTLPRF